MYTTHTWPLLGPQASYIPLHMVAWHGDVDAHGPAQPLLGLFQSNRCCMRVLL